MTGILKFKLPEEEVNFRHAICATDMAIEISDLDRQLRSWIKHGHQFSTPDDALQEVRNLLTRALILASPDDL